MLQIVPKGTIVKGRYKQPRLMSEHHSTFSSTSANKCVVTMLLHLIINLTKLVLHPSRCSIRWNSTDDPGCYLNSLMNNGLFEPDHNINASIHTAPKGHIYPNLNQSLLEFSLHKEKERSHSLLQELEDLNLLNKKLKEFHLQETTRSKTHHERELEETKLLLLEEMTERLAEKDTLIKEIRVNNQQSEDFLRKRINSHETQYKQLEENYAQLKDLFDEYQLKAQHERSNWIEKNKLLQMEMNNLRGRSVVKQENSLGKEYSHLLQKSAKSERRISRINDEIEQITRQYSRRVLNHNDQYHPINELSDQKRTHKSHDTLPRRSEVMSSNMSLFKHKYQTNKEIPGRYCESQRQSPYRSYIGSNDKENQSLVSNFQGVTRFQDKIDLINEDGSHVKIRMERVQPNRDVECRKKKSLQHLVLNSERESTRPPTMQIQTPCFQDKMSFDTKFQKCKKINVKLKRQ